MVTTKVVTDGIIITKANKSLYVMYIGTIPILTRLGWCNTLPVVRLQIIIDFRQVVVPGILDYVVIL